MADIRRSVLELFQQGMDAVNSAVNHVTTATRSKMDELTLQNQRKELMNSVANVVYEQWQQGLQLPEVLTDALAKLRDVDDQLATMAKQPENPEANDDAAAEADQQDADTAPVQEEEPVPTLHVEQDAPTWPEMPFQSEEPGEVPTIRVEEDKEPSSEE